MKFRTIIITLLLLVFTVLPANAIDLAGYNQIQVLRDSALVLEANIFSPKNWKKASKAFAEAKKNVEQNKKQKSIDKKVAEAREFLDNAIKASEVAKLSLSEYLEPRVKAREAKAVSLVPQLYVKAEAQFRKATGKVESGDVKNGLKEADKSKLLFNQAELEAIRVDILSPADRFIARAITDDANKFALSTLDKAKSARKKSNAIITANRYNREDAMVEAKRAEYEARHASNIALSVRALKRNDQAWEKLMMIYEIQMNRVGETIGIATLPYDNGPLAAADTIIASVKSLQAENQQMSEDMKNLSKSLTGKLQEVVGKFDENAVDNSPVELIKIIDEKLFSLTEERDLLAGKVTASEAKLASLASEHETMSSELSSRKEVEEKFMKAKTMFNPSEGEVLYNSSNDIVLRLGGLSFASNKSDIQDGHAVLLGKVIEIIKMYPDAKLIVEGHTDSDGDAYANQTLSEKRAFSVMQYLRQSLLLSADRIQSMGYGADRPIGSNKTESGRAKNRRIDIILMR